jgi:uncharacterized metal-binding protein YceD (DUF177 family)
VRIVIDTIEAGGRRVAADRSDGWAVQAARRALDGEPGALGVDLLFELRGPMVHVTGTVAAQVSVPCDRCGEPVALAVSGPVDLAYVRQEQPVHGEMELHPGDLDVGWFSGEAIDAGDVLSEALALALPSRTVCTDTEACDTRTRALLSEVEAGSPGHPAFAALAGLVRDA